MATGWKYLKMGQCTGCSCASTRLFVPVLNGTETGSKHGGVALINGEHIPHFDPVCFNCTKLYDLDTICASHNLPYQKASGLCGKCFKPGMEYRQRAKRGSKR